MERILLPVYRFLKGHRVLTYILLFASILAFALVGINLRFEEDILKLLPSSGTDNELAFSDIHLKDKVFIQFTSADPENPVDTRELCDMVDSFTEELLIEDSTGVYIAGILSSIGPDLLLGAMDFGLDHIPSFIDTSMYGAIAAALEPDAIAERMAENMEIIMNDETGDETRLVCTDPAGLRDVILKGIISTQGLSGDYTIENGHFFCPDKTVAMAYLAPNFSPMDSGICMRFYRMMKRVIDRKEKENPSIRILCHGNPLASVSNAGTIRRDIGLTVGISLLVIIIIMLMCFHKFSFISQMIIPVIYGTIFSLSCMYWVKGYMSLIALGLGAVILGVAISYALHVLIHYYYVEDTERMLKEEATPVFLGCLTTVGAFLGLLFTESELLRDFGLFATFGLIGSTFYTLVFLPQFLGPSNLKYRRYKGFNGIEKFNDLPWDRSKPLLIGLTVYILIGLVFSHGVKFDSDLRNLNYEDSMLTASQDLYSDKNEDGNRHFFFAVHDHDLDQALDYNDMLMAHLDSLQNEGIITSHTGLVPLLFKSERVQKERIQRWNEFWTAERVNKTMADLSKAAADEELKPSLLAPFKALITSDYSPASLFESGIIPDELVSNFIEKQMSGRYMVFTTVSFAPEKRDIAIAETIRSPKTLVLDPFYYCRDMVEVVHEDFSKTLYISSLFVLIVLLLSFGNLMTAILAFFPMGISWLVLEGYMAIFGLEFNLINIVITTFIFGIGVDYSIFVMQGLLNEARTGKKDLLAYHKVAICFSAMVLMIVVLSLLLAHHPAISSSGLITLIGMATTILLTYSLQPFLFRQLLKIPFFRRSFKLKPTDEPS